MRQPRLSIISLSFFVAIAGGGWFVLAGRSSAAEPLAYKLSGRILLQVEGRGEAWFVSPSDLKRYYLGRPADTLAVMSRLGTGISSANLAKLPIGAISSGSDYDQDGLADDFETAIGTDPAKTDSDSDGFTDRTEAFNQYNPLGPGRQLADRQLAAANRGKIFLQVEDRGQAWYLNPVDSKRYYLGSPANALAVMRSLGLGITDAQLGQIVIGTLPGLMPKPTSTPVEPTPPPLPTPPTSPELSAAAGAIRSGVTADVLPRFTPELQKTMEYNMSFLDSEGRLTLANLMSGATLVSKSDSQQVYAAETYFDLGGYKVKIYFYLDKQADGKWLISKIQ